MPVKFEDNSIKVKRELNDAVIGWLYGVAESVCSLAKDLCQYKSKSEFNGRIGGDLASSYDYQIDEEKGTARIGSTLESAYWEEYGTGEWADTSKNGGKQGRKGWWIYIEGGSDYNGKTNVYSSQQEAEDMAKWISQTHHVNAIATNGLKPHYTVENAMKEIAPRAFDRLRKILGE